MGFLTNVLLDLVLLLRYRIMAREVARDREQNNTAKRTCGERVATFCAEEPHANDVECDTRAVSSTHGEAAKIARLSVFYAQRCACQILAR